MSESAPRAEADGLDPLPGEPGIPSVHQPRRAAVAIKAVLAAAIVVVGLGFAVYATITRFVSSGSSSSSAEERRAPKAAANVGTGRIFDPQTPPPIAAEAGDTRRPPAERVPAIDTEAAPADPISIRSESEGRGSKPSRSPLDAPAVLGLISSPDTRGTVAISEADEPTSTSRQSLQHAQASLDEYQSNLRGMLNDLQRATASASSPGSGSAPELRALQTGLQTGSSLGGQLSAGSTPRISAGSLGNRSLTLPQGTAFTCSLKTKIVSEQSGFVSCQVLRHVYSDDGRVLLVDRGSHLDGEYSARLRNGQSRIFVVWTRLRTPHGVTVDIGSPATGPLGEAGVEGYVDRHWKERVGAALLLSVIEDGMKIAAAEAASRDGDGTSIILSDQADTTSSLAEKVLDSTINIPPTIYKLHGQVVGIYVARDVSFSSVYALRTAAR